MALEKCKNSICKSAYLSLRDGVRNHAVSLLPLSSILFENEESLSSLETGFSDTVKE